MSLIRKHGAVLQAWACLALVLCGCFVFLTQDKFDIVQFIPTQIKFRATPLLASIQTLSLKTGTPPLRGELMVLPQGGSTFVSGGSTPPPLRGGWINPCACPICLSIVGARRTLGSTTTAALPNVGLVNLSALSDALNRVTSPPRLPRRAHNAALRRRKRETFWQSKTRNLS